MKKLFLIVSVAVAVGMTGCKTARVESVQTEPQVHPLALISADLSTYMSVPVKKHQDLVSKIVCSVVNGMSESNAMTICERTDMLYSGLGTVKDRSHLETASFTKVSKFEVGQVMTKKNGFDKETVLFDSGEMTKYKSNASNFEIAFPSTKILCMSQNVNPMLDKFSQRCEVKETEYNKWISQKSDDILFYITRPGQYLRNLIGQTVSVGTDVIYGSISYLPDRKKPDQYSGRYNLSFYIHLTNKKAASALNALLSLSFSMMGGSVTQTDPETLYLSNIEITDRQITELFTRDPITGKHYRVVGDEVIEESVKK